MRLVIAAPSRMVARASLQQLGVSPVAFMRRDVWVVTSYADVRERIQGLPSFIWCLVPDSSVPPHMRSELNARSHQRNSEMSFHEAVARVLAYRAYHEC